MYKLARIFRSRLPWRIKRKVEYFSLFECPECGKRGKEQMPGNASVYFHHCFRCNHIITPKPGDCCVFCSYGKTPCPWQQRERMGLPHPNLSS
jgi:hypothetical protein